MNAREKSRSDQRVRPWFLILTSLILLCGIAAVWTRWSAHPGAEPSEQLPAETAGLESNVIPPVPHELGQSPSPTPAPTAASLPRPTAAPLPQSTPYARQLVAAITRRDRANVPLTPEEAEQWKKCLAQLIQQGADGATAVAEFLQTNNDIRFGPAGLELLGVDSVREALFDALVQIGGPAGISASLQALHTSAAPREIALLARNLDSMAPETYRQDALSAARQVLTTAATAKSPDSDVGPLFEVFQRYGGSDVVPELQQVAHTWPYYSSIALASLPDGVGVPALDQLAEAGGSDPTMALRGLAQLSGKQGAAQLALIGRAQAGSIPAAAWPSLVTLLAGNEYHFENSVFAGPPGPGNTVAHMRVGNESFYNAFTPSNLPQEEINARVAFIHQLRSVTSQPAALEALQQAEQLLMERLPNVVATPQLVPHGD